MPAYLASGPKGGGMNIPPHGNSTYYIWAFGHLGILAIGHLGIWAFGHVGIWASLLTVIEYDVL